MQNKYAEVTPRYFNPMSTVSHYASRSPSANWVCRAEIAVPPKCANETRARRSRQMPHKFVSA